MKSRTRARWASAEETAVAVLVDEGDEFIDRGDFRHRVVAVPLQVAALPEDTPRPPCLHVRGLGDRALAILARCPFPEGANFEDLDTLARDPKTRSSWARRCRGGRRRSMN